MYQILYPKPAWVEDDNYECEWRITYLPNSMLIFRLHLLLSFFFLLLPLSSHSLGYFGLEIDGLVMALDGSFLMDLLNFREELFSVDESQSKCKKRGSKQQREHTQPNHDVPENWLETTPFYPRKGVVSSHSKCVGWWLNILTRHAPNSCTCWVYRVALLQLSQDSKSESSY